MTVSAPHVEIEGDPDLPIILLSEGATRIGRGDDCEVVLADSSLSREHCRLVRQGKRVVLVDSGSRNGTWVGGIHVRRRELHDGDVIELGRSRLVYRGPATASPPATVRVGPGGAFMVALLLVTVAGVTYYLDGRRRDEIAAAEIAREREQAAVSDTAVMIGRVELLQADFDRLARVLREKELELEESQRWHQEALDTMSRAGAEAQALQQREADAELARLSRERDGLSGQAGELEAKLAEMREELESARRAQQIASMARERERVAEAGEQPMVEHPRVVTGDAVELATRVLAELEDYADPGADASGMLVLLDDLVAIPTVAAGEGVVALVDRALELWQHHEASERYLAGRVEDLRRLARRGGSPGRSKETNQRLLDLSSRKLKILEGKGLRLAVMRDGILAAAGNIAHPEACEALAQRWPRDRRLPLRLAFVSSFKLAGYQAAVPILVEALSSRDDGLRQAVHEALKAITGVDHGSSRTAWRRWLGDSSR